MVGNTIQLSNRIFVPMTLIERSSLLLQLQKKVDQATEQEHPHFEAFNDSEMIYWFLYQSKHLDVQDGRAERTKQAYEQEIKQFLQYLMKYHEEMEITFTNLQSDSLFRSLNAVHLRKYQQWLKDRSPYVLKRKQPYAKATLERKTTILKQFFNFLYQVQYISAPIAEGFKLVHVRKDERPNRDMSSKDVVRVLDECIKTKNIYMFVLIQVLVTTGMRNEELCRLRVKDLKLHYLGNSYYLSVLGKGNKLRDIPLRDKVVESIGIYRAARGVPSIQESPADAPLFPTSTGKAFSPSFLSQTFNRELNKLELAKQISVKLSPHVFRHAFAIISRMNKVDIYDIMRSLGHEKVETTMIYLEKIFEQEKHAIHQWDAATMNDLI